MSAPAMATFRSRLVRALHRMGWAGAVGAGLLAFALAFGYTVAADQTARRETLGAERARLLKMAAHPELDRRSDRQRLEAFYARFPQSADLASRLQELHRLAESHGVVLAQGDYRVSRDAGTGLQRVSLNLPVSGAFQPTYEWLSEVLATMPEVALEGLTLKRERTDEGSLDMELRLVLFVRGNS